LLGYRAVRTFAVIAAVAGALAAAPPAARADDIVAYQADGDAAAAAPDARVAALDEAFAKAVGQAVGDLVEPEVRRQSKPVIDRELVGHARLWVARFTVTREAVADDRKQLSVSVRIDRNKLRARLAELNIATRDATRDAGRDASHDAGDAAAAAPTQSVVALIRVAGPDGVHASYGLAAEKEVSGLVALSSVLRRANLAVLRAPASGPAARPDGDLPLDDDAAGALAADAKAELAMVAGIAVGAPVPLRGVAADGVLVTAHLRLYDPKARRAVGQGVAVAASRGADPGMIGYAIDRAVLSATADVLPQPAQSLAQPAAFTGDDTPVAEPGVVLIRLARATPWTMVQTELKHLIGARGISRATLRRVSPSGWVIGVATTDSIDRIASIVKKPPAADITVSAKIVGEVVEATLSGAP
jgi:hypothetical protein